MTRQPLLIGVIGGHQCSRSTYRVAQQLGDALARMGAVVVCGGLGGVMEAVAQGAREAGGLTVGILPQDDKRRANQFIDIPIATGLGYTRNTLVTTAADIIIAMPGQYGTLSEIGFALNAKKPVIGIGSWKIKGVKQAKTVSAAMKYVRRYAR